MTPARYLAWKLEATFGGLASAWTAFEWVLQLAAVLFLAGLFTAAVAARFRREPRGRRGSQPAHPRTGARRYARLRLMMIAWSTGVVACGAESDATPRPPLAESEPKAMPEAAVDAQRDAIADTLRELYRDGSQTFDSAAECAEIADWLADRASVLFVSQGRLETGGREDGIMDMCQAIKRDRLSAEEEIHEQRVELLNRDAAVVVTRSTYTVRYRDGRTTARPQVVTTAWSRGRDGWRMVHLHESWLTGGQPR